MRSRWVCSQSSCAPSGGHSCWHSCWHSSARHRSCSTARSACRPTIWTWLGRLGDLQFASTLLPRPNAWPATSCCDRLLWMPLGQWEWTTCWSCTIQSCQQCRMALLWWCSNAILARPQPTMSSCRQSSGVRSMLWLCIALTIGTLAAPMLQLCGRFSSCLQQQQQQQQQQPLTRVLRMLLSIAISTPAPAFRPARPCRTSWA